MAVDVDGEVADGQRLLLPGGRATRRGVRVLPLSDPPVVLRAYAVTRRGREQWAPLRVVLERLAD